MKRGLIVFFTAVCMKLDANFFFNRATVKVSANGYKSAVRTGNRTRLIPKFGYETSRGSLQKRSGVQWMVCGCGAVGGCILLGRVGLREPVDEILR